MDTEVASKKVPAIRGMGEAAHLHDMLSAIFSSSCKQGIVWKWKSALELISGVPATLLQVTDAKCRTREGFCL